MEIEAKFSAPDAATLERLDRLSELAGYQVGGREVADMSDVYLDSDERALQAAGMVCRRRDRGDRVVITVKRHLGAPGDVEADGSAEAIYAARAVENTARCVPPLPDDTIRSIAQGMLRYQPGSEVTEETGPSEAGILIAYDVDDILAYQTEQIDYFVDQVLGPEKVTILAAKPKAGKTTWAFGAISAMQRGVPFMGFTTRPARVLYVSEQNRRTL